MNANILKLGDGPHKNIMTLTISTVCIVILSLALIRHIVIIFILVSYYSYWKENLFVVVVTYSAVVNPIYSQTHLTA